MSMERMADQLLAKAGVNTIPVPVKRIANHLGIKIESASFGERLLGCTRPETETALSLVLIRNTTPTGSASALHTKSPISFSTEAILT